MIKRKVSKKFREIKYDKELRVQFLKFISVGVLNTAISLIVIYLLMGIGVNYKISNFAGYILGLINSFIFNKLWIFKTKKNLIKESILFIFVFAICYCLQYVALLIMVEKLMWNNYLSQFLGMGLYTVLNFILNRILTFKKRI